MARPTSKIMTIADKKVAEAGLKTALKTHSESAKAVAAEYKLAQGVLAAALKAADVIVKEASKVHVTAIKAADKTVSEAKKVFDAAAKKYEKLNGAADKGKAKLMTQISDLAAVEAQAPVKVSKAAKAAAADATV